MRDEISNHGYFNEASASPKNVSPSVACLAQKSGAPSFNAAIETRDLSKAKLHARIAFA